MSSGRESCPCRGQLVSAAPLRWACSSSNEAKGRLPPSARAAVRPAGRAALSHVSPEALRAPGHRMSGVSGRHPASRPRAPPAAAAGPSRPVLSVQRRPRLTHSEKAPPPRRPHVSSADFRPGLPGREELVPRERRLRLVRVPEAVAHVQHRHARNDQPCPVHR